jgi:hypothetical protein
VNCAMAAMRSTPPRVTAADSCHPPCSSQCLAVAQTLSGPRCWASPPSTLAAPSCCWACRWGHGSVASATAEAALLFVPRTSRDGCPAGTGGAWFLTQRPPPPRLAAGRRQDRHHPLPAGPPRPRWLPQHRAGGGGARGGGRYPSHLHRHARLGALCGCAPTRLVA